MKPDSFDAYHESYDKLIDNSIGFMGVEHDFYTKAKAECLVRCLRRMYGSTSALNVLDVGCGVGKTDTILVPHFNALSGVDVSAACIERAKHDNPSVQYSGYDGGALPYTAARFDAAFMICVLHHVAPPERVELLREVRRVIRPGGSVFVFEHNPFHPLTRFVVARCVFDRGVSLLSRRETVGLLREAGLRYDDSQYILYVPFDLHRLEFPAVFRRWFPFGTQFFASGVK